MTRATPSIDALEREDLMMFLNACFACTGQREFYSSASRQQLSVDFLHAYTIGNYRRLYSLCLAAGINDFNQAEIIHRLLRSGAPADPEHRRKEGALIAAALDRMPPQRVYRLFERLRETRVNNRRTRAVIRDWLARRRDPTFDAIKYRAHLRSVARHLHVDFARLTGSDELGAFLFAGPDSRKSWRAPLLEVFRRARYDRSAIYELPFTIAEGLAASAGISRKKFLAGIEPRMTAAERFRLEQSQRRAGASWSAVDLARQPLTRLALYLLSRSQDELTRDRAMFDDALRQAAERASRHMPTQLGAVCAVLDCSFSSRGSTHKANRPLALSLAIGAILRAYARDYRAFWTTPDADPLTLRARGQTNLARPLLDALRARPALVVIVSDGFENDPPGAVHEIIRIFRDRIDRDGDTEIVHVNPVFDSESYMPRKLSALVPTVGIRDAEDVASALAFARFVGGSLPLADLEIFLSERADRLIQHVATAQARRAARREAS